MEPKKNELKKKKKLGNYIIYTKLLGTSKNGEVNLCLHQ